ncbi:hypothetical protein HDU88_004843 [Geranomyces variabilis]|nr:hypothetical protein HDU88_004843 [Geranomyces variabilis]
MPPIVSKNHVYDDADVRIVVGNTAFLVHTLVLKLKSEYFEACFRGPWTESTEVIDGRTLRQVTINDVDSKEFSQLLDWMYRPELCFDAIKAFPLVKIADRFQVVSLFKYLDQLRPPKLTWKNIEHWLETATTGPRRFEKCVDCCTNFLLKPVPGLYVRALYLSEKYNLARFSPNPDDIAKYTVSPPHQDQDFGHLSVTLQRDLLLAHVQRNDIFFPTDAVVNEPGGTWDFEESWN